MHLSDLVKIILKAIAFEFRFNPKKIHTISYANSNTIIQRISSSTLSKLSLGYHQTVFIKQFRFLKKKFHSYRKKLTEEAPESDPVKVDSNVDSLPEITSKSARYIL